MIVDQVGAENPSSDTLLNVGRKTAVADQEGNSKATKKLIYVLPRIRLTGTAFGQDFFSVSKAHFHPDKEKTWNEVIKLPRPEWLDIYREFPELDEVAEAQPARGTLVFSDDEHWLKLHIGRLLAIVYLMGSRKWQTHADAFRYTSFLATEHPQDMVELFTKSGRKIENLRSLQLLPPLELRGANSNFQVALTDERNAELMKRFDQNPYDRLGAACYHLFRSQIDDPFFAPRQQDAAAFCACLEAAFDVQGPGYKEKLIDALQSLYGQHPKFARWIKGLYSERSVFNHGVAIDPDHESENDNEVAQAEYRDRHLSWDVLRHLCFDVIHEQLQDSIEATQRVLARLMSPMRTMLRQFFYSDEAWNEIAKPLTATQSTTTILNLKDDALGDFIELCCEFLNAHRWEAMNRDVEHDQVFKALKTLGAVIHELGKQQGKKADTDAGEALYDVADAGNIDAIKAWHRRHAPHYSNLPPDDLGNTVKSVAIRTVTFFKV